MFYKSCKKSSLMISVLSLCLAVPRVVSVFIFLFAPSLSVVAYLVSVLLSTVVLLLVFVLVRVAALALVLVSLVRTFLFRGRFFSLLSVFLYVGIFRVTAATAVFAITATTTTAITAASTAAAAAAITVIAQVFATGCFLLF